MDQVTTILEAEVAGQGVFVSRYSHNLDPKKRLTIPSEWRAQVGSPKSLYVLPDVHERCLRVSPSGEILQRLDRLRHHSIADRKARQFARQLASQSDIVSWDSQGRIRIKDELLTTAGLEEQVVMLGAFDSFELWSPDKLEAAGGITEDSMKEAARYVGF